jgi:hypothetical protein
VFYFQDLKKQWWDWHLQSIKLQKSFYSPNFLFTCAVMSWLAKFQFFFASTILIPDYVIWIIWFIVTAYCWYQYSWIWHIGHRRNIAPTFHTD